MPKSCNNCIYSKQLPNMNHMLCRRYPPSHLVSKGSRESYYFPTVNQEEWCGEYQAKPKVKDVCQLPAEEKKDKKAHPDIMDDIEI
jgi:hypothetical protein